MECNFQVNEITCIDALYQNTNTSHNQRIVTLDKLKLAWKNNIPYEKLITSVRSGFPESKMKREPDLRPFWKFQIDCHVQMISLA